MPLNPNLHKVMVIGSGPIVIGQAAEFDYAGTQACRALKAEGLEVVLVNSNPATIMTDNAMADHIYIEPLTVETVKRIIEKEKPDSLLSTLGGQTGLTLSMQLAKRVKGLHFPMMVAGGYTCMILGQCLGPSATLYSNLATEGSSYAEIVGHTMTVLETCYNTPNVVLFFVLAIAFILIVLFTQPGEDELIELRDVATQADVVPNDYKITGKAVTFAQKMNTCKPVMWVVGAFIFINIIYDFATKGFFGALNMNLVIFLFVGINCFLFPQPSAWITAHADSMHLATDIIMQFPFYGAIMGMMYIEGGLGSVLITAITSIATARSLPVFTFLSACLVNCFIPSQGGQFTVQGPLIVQTVQNIQGADLATCLNAFVLGDECTNLLQPLYVIPALSVVGMKLKDVWGFMAFICVFWIIITCLGLYFIPMFV